MATALIQLTQGIHTDVAGTAVKGDLTSGVVLVSNGDNTGVTAWKWELLYVPPGSLIALMTQGPGPVSTFSFPQPDAPGSYRVRLTVMDSLGNQDVDIRCLCVAFPNGIIAPPAQNNPVQLPETGVGAKPDEMNVGGQSYGWAGDNNSGRKLLHQVLALVDSMSMGTVPTSRAVATTAPLTGGGDLSTDRNLGVSVDNASVVVVGGSLAVGAINDTQHGNRGGGSLHAIATGSVAGFMSAAMVTALAAAVSIGGDLSGSPSAPTVSQVHGVAYPASPTTNTVPVVTSSNVVTYEKLPLSAFDTSGIAGQVLIGQGTGTSAPVWSYSETLGQAGGSAGSNMGALNVNNGSTTAVHIAPYTGGSSYGAIWLGTVAAAAPSNTNAFAYSDGGTVYLNFGSSNSMVVQAGGGNVFQWTAARSISVNPIAIGTNPALTGALQLANAASVSFRNAANSADLVGLTVDSNNNFNVGPYNLTNLYTNVVVDPSGWTIAGAGNNASVCTFSVNAGTRTLTVTPVSTNFTYYVQGQAYTSTAQSVVWTATEGLWYFYFDNTNTLKATQSTTTWASVIAGSGAGVAILYWDNTNATVLDLNEERHGTQMPGTTHSYLHLYFHTQYRYPGLDLGNFTIGNGSSNTHAQFSVANGVIADEDITVNITSGSPQTLSTIAQIPIFYLSGATPVWRKKTADNYPLIQSGSAGYTSGAGRAAYNQLTGGSWQLTDATQGNYFHVYYFATNDVNTPIIGVLGQATYGSLAASDTAVSTEATSVLSFISTLIPEYKLIAAVVFQTSSSYSNAVSTRIVQTVAGGNYYDYRSNAVSAGIGSTGANIAYSSLTGQPTLTGTAPIQVAGNSGTPQTLATNLTISISATPNFTSVSLGATPSTTGALQLTNATYIGWRNGTNSGDILAVGVDSIGNLQLTAIATTGQVSFNNDLQINSKNILSVGYATFGAHPSTTGAVNLTNAQYVYSRNAANSLDLPLIGTDASNNLNIGSASYPSSVVINVGSSQTIRLGVNGTYVAGVGANGLTTGATPAATGAIALSNAQYVYARNAANSLDLRLLGTDSSNNLNIGGASHPGTMNFNLGSSQSFVWGIDVATVATLSGTGLAVTSGLSASTCTLVGASTGGVLTAQSFGTSGTMATLGYVTTSYNGAVNVRMGAVPSFPTRSALWFGASAATPDYTNFLIDQFSGYTRLNGQTGDILVLGHGDNVFGVQTTWVGSAIPVIAWIPNGNGVLSVFQAAGSIQQLNTATSQGAPTYSTTAGAVYLGNACAGIGQTDAYNYTLKTDSSTGVTQLNAPYSPSGPQIIFSVQQTSITTAPTTVMTASNTGLAVTGVSIAVGTNPAGVGSLRIANATYLNARNAANTGDLQLLGVDASNNVQIGGAGAGTAGVVITSNGSSTIAQVVGSTTISSASSTGLAVTGTLSVSSYCVFTASSAPSGNPSSGQGYLYNESGAGKWRSPSGTTTTFGPADPHCPRCGRDFAHEWENTKTGEALSVCVPCMMSALEKAGVATSDYTIQNTLKQAA